MITRDRLSRIFYRKKFYNYPLEAIEGLANLGKRESALRVLSYLKSKLRRNDTPKKFRRMGGWKAWEQALPHIF